MVVTTKDLPKLHHFKQRYFNSLKLIHFQKMFLSHRVPFRVRMQLTFNNSLRGGRRGLEVTGVHTDRDVMVLISIRPNLFWIANLESVLQYKFTNLSLFAKSERLF